MENRRRLVCEILSEGVSLSEACRRAGVTRKTGLKWVNRARESGVEAMEELSRAPKSCPKRTCLETQNALLALKDRYPEWGAAKLTRILQTESGICLPPRTGDEILRRCGRTKKASRAASQPLERFERDACGALLQMDFKGLPQTVPYSVLSVLDDHGRYCLAFEALEDKTGHSVKEALWRLFGTHGLPDSILSDNGDCWGSATSKAPSRLEAWLMLLGIEPIHGRPGHPQTQGKVERFHLTAKIELGTQLFQPSIEEVRPILKDFVQRYNWVRPHDALGGKVPGSRYEPFPRRRPDKLPEHQIPPGSITRRVDQDGLIYFKNVIYKLGKGLHGNSVVLKEDEFGIRTYFQGFPLAYISELKIYS